MKLWRCADLTRCASCPPRGGFSNLELALALGLLAVIALLLMVQRGEISISFGAAEKKAKATDQAGSSAGTAPELFLSPRDPLRETRQRWVASQLAEQARTIRRVRETQQALGVMDPAAAARMLSQLTPAAAAAAMARLHERQLAHILEQAEPAVAAQWVSELLKLPAAPEIPVELKAAAAAAGLYDDTAEALAAARAGQEVSDGAAPAAESAAPAPEPPAASDSADSAPPGAEANPNQEAPPAESPTPTADETSTTDGALVARRIPPARAGSGPATA